MNLAPGGRVNSPTMNTKPASNEPPRRKIRATHSPTARDIFDAGLGHADALLQRTFVNPKNYDSVPWRRAVRDIEAALGGRATEILNESALEKVEDDVRSLLADIPPNEGFHKKWAADSLLAHFSYLACRLMKPNVAVETGVAYGVSSAFILAAMEENGFGELHSVDLRPLRRNPRRFHGIAVPEESKKKWTLHHGSSRRVLPKLTDELETVDFFLHDSLHTQRNMRFEFEEVWPHLRPGGVILADDVERNGAFGELEKKEPSLWRVVKDRETKPLHGNKAPVTFGVMVK
ncbi:MAG: class I SAM-dependent methyltransferase [Rubrobacter sp.]|nr:class I SAM-dependent methyltransferase [Rubrobacter sp.]